MWTEEIQTFCALGSLVFSAVSIFLTAPTLAMQAKTSQEQTEMIKLENKKFRLSHLPNVNLVEKYSSADDNQIRFSLFSNKGQFVVKEIQTFCKNPIFIKSDYDDIPFEAEIDVG